MTTKTRKGRLGIWALPLRARLLTLLSIALLPLGAIAVWQTIEVSNDARRLAEQDVLSRTERAARDYVAVIRRATGAAGALGITAARLDDDPEACSAIMRGFVDTNAHYVFTGFIARDGIMRCNSTGDIIDYTRQRDWLDFLDDPRNIARVNPQGGASAPPVFIILAPIYDAAGDFLGGQVISIPEEISQSLLIQGSSDVDLALVAPDGDILASESGLGVSARLSDFDLMPGDMQIPQRGIIVRNANVSGPTESLALVPLIPGQVYVVGIWADTAVAQSLFSFGRSAPLFPALMWLASLIVAYLTVSRLVVRPLGKLAIRIANFNTDATAYAPPLSRGAPREFVDLSDQFEDMAVRVAHDQAMLEASLKEKDTLLREVYHRVKNNLQLISSILNMKMRDVSDPKARLVLQGVQDRVMSLATIHRMLYATPLTAEVQVDRLLQDVVNGAVNTGAPSNDAVTVTSQLAPITLDPDQAVPLSLLTTEAVTNAVKYVGKSGGSTAWIDVRLTQAVDKVIVLSIANSHGAPLLPDDVRDGSGLGMRLIKAFASQLGGTLDQAKTDAEFRLTVQFTPMTMVA